MNVSSSLPRIFISYARSDGEDFARNLRRRLVEEYDFAVWQDRTKMQAGELWWQQIVTALKNKHVEYMVLVMTPAAALSKNQVIYHRGERGGCRVSIPFSTLCVALRTLR